MVVQRTPRESLSPPPGDRLANGLRTEEGERNDLASRRRAIQECQDDNRRRMPDRRKSAPGYRATKTRENEVNSENWSPKNCPDVTVSKLRSPKVYGRSKSVLTSPRSVAQTPACTDGTLFQDPSPRNGNLTGRATEFILFDAASSNKMTPSQTNDDSRIKLTPQSAWWNQPEARALSYMQKQSGYTPSSQPISSPAGRNTEEPHQFNLWTPSDNTQRSASQYTTPQSYTQYNTMPPSPGCMGGYSTSTVETHMVQQQLMRMIEQLQQLQLNLQQLCQEQKQQLPNLMHQQLQQQLQQLFQLQVQLQLLPHSAPPQAKEEMQLQQEQLQVLHQQLLEFPTQMQQQLSHSQEQLELRLHQQQEQLAQLLLRHELPEQQQMQQEQQVEQQRQQLAQLQKQLEALPEQQEHLLHDLQQKTQQRLQQQQQQLDKLKLELQRIPAESTHALLEERLAAVEQHLRRVTGFDTGTPCDAVPASVQTAVASVQTAEASVQTAEAPLQTAEAPLQAAEAPLQAAPKVLPVLSIQAQSNSAREVRSRTQRSVRRVRPQVRRLRLHDFHRHRRTRQGLAPAYTGPGFLSVTPSLASSVTQIAPVASASVTPIPPVASASVTPITPVKSASVTPIAPVESASVTPISSVASASVNPISSVASVTPIVPATSASSTSLEAHVSFMTPCRLFMGIVLCLMAFSAPVLGVANLRPFLEEFLNPSWAERSDGPMDSTLDLHSVDTSDISCHRDSATDILRRADFTSDILYSVDSTSDISCSDSTADILRRVDSTAEILEPVDSSVESSQPTDSTAEILEEADSTADIAQPADSTLQSVSNPSWAEPIEVQSWCKIAGVAMTVTPMAILWARR